MGATRAIAVAALALGVFGVGVGPAVGGPVPTPTGARRLIDVPYFSQTPALCGGAALAMVLRYWGDRTVQPSDFQSLVNRSAAGILTSDLVAAVSRRGWRAIPGQAREASALRDLGPQIDQGRPAIALIERSPGQFHYVVVVGLTETNVVLHDPARTSFDVVPADAFDREWRNGGGWFLIVLPRAAAAGASVPGHAAVAATSPGRSGACGALVDRGVALADTNTEKAESVLRTAREFCPESAEPWLELAGLSFKAGEWREAASLAERATTLDPENQDAWELLGSARYLADDDSGALEAWNHVREPPIDVVTISGARRTPQPALIRLIGLEPRTVLTPEAFSRAARQLSDAPTASSTRLMYVPEADDRVAVSAAIAERDAFPHEPMAIALLVAHSVVSDELRLSLAGLAGQGELVTGEWRWPSGRPLVGGALELPAPAPFPGVVSINGFWERQSYDVPVPSGGSALVQDERRRVTFDVGSWMSGHTRLDAGSGLDRFGDADYVSMRAAIEEHVDGDRIVARAEGQVWRLGPGAGFSTRDVSLAWRSRQDQLAAPWSGLGGVADASATAPRALWMGAGTGQGRPVLLRAHPLLDGNVIAGPMFGRRIVFQTIEYHHLLKHALAGTIGVAAFVDAARASGGLVVAAPPAFNVDAGVGLRLRLTQGGVARLDFARGLEDGRMAVSLGWSSSVGSPFNRNPW